MDHRQAVDLLASRMFSESRLTAPITAYMSVNAFNELAEELGWPERLPENIPYIVRLSDNQFDLVEDLP